MNVGGTLRSSSHSAQPELTLCGCRVTRRDTPLQWATAQRIRVEHGISYLKNWRALSRPGPQAIPEFPPLW